MSTKNQKVVVVDSDFKTGLKLARSLEQIGFDVIRSDSFAKVFSELLDSPQHGEPDLRPFTYCFRTGRNTETEAANIRHSVHVKLRLEECFGRLLNYVEACNDRLEMKPRPRVARKNFSSDLHRFRDEAELLDVIGFEKRIVYLCERMELLCDRLDEHNARSFPLLFRFLRGYL